MKNNKGRQEQALGSISVHKRMNTVESCQQKGDAYSLTYAGRESKASTDSYMS